MHRLRLHLRPLIVIAMMLSSFIPAMIPSDGYATKYGAGSYGRCQYETCAISLSSSGSVGVNVTPAPGATRCSVSSDAVTVTTSSSTGYVLTLADTDATTTLVNGAKTIAASTATFASPAMLTTNSWGYRVDGQGGFGTGPTSALSSGATPSAVFAGIQPSTGTADTLINSSTAATNGVTTNVWYGVCVNSTQASGAYSDSVLYTAVVN